MPIYTRTGDKGQTKLLDGTIIPKSNLRVDTYGAIDELNSEIGAALAHFKQGKFVRIQKELIKIQHDLFEIGSALATPGDIPVVGLKQRVVDFEKLIDRFTESLPKLHNFILPGGSSAGSLLHIARTVARRAERKVVDLMQKQPLDITIVQYLNRLSDLLFTMARQVNLDAQKKEIIWSKK